MTESKRRANIEKIQARQNRYKAMGRCWCGREVRLGYKRCDNCIDRYNQRRVNYREAGRCNCGNLIFGIKQNGTPYKTCYPCRQRARAHYHQRREGL